MTLVVLKSSVTIALFCVYRLPVITQAQVIHGYSAIVLTLVDGLKVF